jgi:hypothetical protein
MLKLSYLLLILALLTACQQHPERTSKASATKTFRPEDHLDTVKEFKVEPGEKLLFQDKVLASFVDAKKRGAGVISFDFDVNDRLDILDMDGSTFGFLVLNEDKSFYTLEMPVKVVARKFIPEFDFQAFDFDAEPVETKADYLLIFVNKKLRKVKKAGTKYRFTDWKQYLIGEKDSADVAED